MFVPRTRERDWGAGPGDLVTGGLALPASFLPQGRGYTKGHVTDHCDGVARLQGGRGGRLCLWSPLVFLRGGALINCSPRVTFCPWPLSVAPGVRAVAAAWSHVPALTTPFPVIWLRTQIKPPLRAPRKWLQGAWGGELGSSERPDKAALLGGLSWSRDPPPCETIPLRGNQGAWDQLFPELGPLASLSPGHRRTERG